jgi:hypothetical protein
LHDAICITFSVVCCIALQVLHVGDRFSDTGNDTATRDCCSIVWVANPEETGFFVKMLLKVRLLAWLQCLLHSCCCIACCMAAAALLAAESCCCSACNQV